MGLGTPEIILIALVVLLLFGAKRMPDMARSMGESLNIFKKSVKESDDTPSAPAPPAPPVQQSQVTGVADPTPPVKSERTES